MLRHAKACASCDMGTPTSLDTWESARSCGLAAVKKRAVRFFGDLKIFQPFACA